MDNKKVKLKSAGDIINRFLYDPLFELEEVMVGYKNFDGIVDTTLENFQDKELPQHRIYFFKIRFDDFTEWLEDKVHNELEEEKWLNCDLPKELELEEQDNFLIVWDRNKRIDLVTDMSYKDKIEEIQESRLELLKNQNPYV
eukprot:TRINITY_DN1053_c0_g1_i1.p1 TRINITY_DN1053_c0_g1~~TRINITY_DN1053_c0_g1_i1.p1  ORF type:complete len:142 (+),score=39.76 TRINITY_DN1053_c0_g1_i1:230-655(+)